MSRQAMSRLKLQIFPKFFFFSCKVTMNRGSRASSRGGRGSTRGGTRGGYRGKPSDSKFQKGRGHKQENTSPHGTKGFKSFPC